MKVCALKFTEKERERMTGAKRKCTTFDQLAINRPKGENIILLRGTRNREERNTLIKPQDYLILILNLM